MLQNERSVLVARNTFRTQVDAAIDIKHSRFVTYREDDPLLTTYVKKHYPNVKTEDLQIAVSVNSHRSMIDTLMTVDAVAVMPMQSVQDALQARHLHVVSKRDLVGKLYLSSRATFSSSRLGTIFLDYMAKPE